MRCDSLEEIEVGAFQGSGGFTGDFEAIENIDKWELEIPHKHPLLQTKISTKLRHTLQHHLPLLHMS